MVMSDSEVNTCVCCGEIIPEGTWVCPKCSEGDYFKAVMARPVNTESEGKNTVESTIL